MRLIEPLGLLHGAAASEATAAGLALPLAGGPAAFTLARLIPRDAPEQLVQATAVPPDWRPELARVTTAPPLWAGLPAERPTIMGPAIMGIVNVTPDSFSDPGRHYDPAIAIAAGLEMAASGAAILDVGGESTRPHAEAVSPAEEQSRILPVIRALAAAGHVVSVDTRNAATMAAALDAGARIVNDVSALSHDPDAARVVAQRRCPVVLMHMRGTPADMQTHTHYANPAYDVLDELAASLARARAADIAPNRILIDPGIGFAKNAPQNRELLYRLSLFVNLGCHIMLGVSRKSLIGHINQEPDPLRRQAGSLAAGLFGLTRGAAILRTHDVPETLQAIRTWQYLLARDDQIFTTHDSNSLSTITVPAAMDR